MADEWKLSIPIEVNLNNLDNSLNMAQTKIQAAGVRMQAAANFNIGGMTGGGLMAGAGPSGMGPGGVSFGGKLDARSAAQWNQRQNTQNFLSLAGLMPGGGILGGAGMVGAAVSATAYQINAVQSAAMNMAAAGRGLSNIRTDIGFANRALARGDAGYAQGAYGSVENRIRGLPGVGGMIGSSIDQFRENMQYNSNVFGVNTRLGRMFQDMSYNPKTQGAAFDRAMELQLSAQKGIFGGSYQGQMQQLGYEMSVTNPREIEDARRGGATSGMLDALRKSQIADIARRHQEITVTESNAMRSINTQTTQSRLRAFGLPGLANIAGIQADLANQLAVLRPDDEKRGALTRAANAAIFESIQSGMQPAQQFVPSTMDLGPGAIRPGTMRNQDPAVLQHLASMDWKLSDMPAVVGR